MPSGPQRGAPSAGRLGDRLAFSSIEIFAREYLYLPSEFGGECPRGLNRHLALHGRDAPQRWRHTDAMRLLNASATATAFAQPVGAGD